MDIVKEYQEIQIGSYKARIDHSGEQWWCCCLSADTNSKLFTQFGITKEDIHDLLGYTLHGAFPPCKSAEELTKVIEFILSKDPANKPDLEDHTGKTIRALVNNPQSTGVQIGEEIKILKAYNTSSYVLDKNAKGTSGMWINRPLNLKEWILVGESSTEVDMKAIQEECKRRFPIGCKYQGTEDKTAKVLKKDYSTYSVQRNDTIYAHEGGGCLYKNGKYATLVSLPEEKKPSIPEYVECINRNHFASDYSHIRVGKVFKWTDLIDGTEGTLNKNYNLWTEQFKPSTKEAYDAQFTKQELAYAYVGDPLPTIKTKPLIEDVQSVSVNLRTKKNNNKFKF